MGETLRATLSLMLSLALGCDGVSETDAGNTSDAGMDATVYMTPDSGSPGAALEPTSACDDVRAALYETPAGLPPFDPSVRGELLGCSELESIDQAALTARLPDGAVVISGVRVYLVAFRTATAPNVGAISTAIVVLPDVAISARVPLVLAMHGSVGLPDTCAPSILRDDPPPAWLRASYVDALLLSWAARGMPVIAPDYPGLGTEGTHAYASWEEVARSGIDAARALRSMLPADRLAGDTMVYGHSQGGGLALAVAAVADEAPDVELSALVSFATGYRVVTLVDALRLPMFELDFVLRATVAIGLYAEMSQITTDPTELASMFAAPVRDRVVEVAQTECFGDAVLALDAASEGYVPPTMLNGLVDEGFRTSVIACADDGVCAEPVGAFVARDAANEPHLDASAPPILFIASDTDEALSSGLLGCAIDRIRRDGAAFEACMQSGPDHLGVVEEGTVYAIEWALAARGGDARPPCEGSIRAPRCSLF
jgi:pimeloyl-ACP methyl ester carboxylesterase